MLKNFGELILYLTTDLLEGQCECLTTMFYKDAIVFKLTEPQPIIITYYPTIANKDKCVIIECATYTHEDLKKFKLICEIAETIAAYRSVIDNEFFKEVEVYEDDC